MRLNDFIKNNYNEFDNEQPSDGHFIRFEERLKLEKRKKNRNRNLKWLLSVAAAILVGMVFWISTNKQTTQTCIWSDEMIEIQAYYQTIIEKKVNHLKGILDTVDNETRKEVMGDIDNIIMSSEKFASEFCNTYEEGISIMVNYYQNEIQALQQITSVFEKNVV